ncbi:hypothetical protein [Mycolicibacterium fallax]|uniref:Uncharacterized protein n=1 Tax=Mycolicibacterium fallax TaxID=1793 RepID=A0A1X1RGP6_MYCFA|nr:hypothetical protein [Mycolicibacterium fallax]ORV05534.1 hypothetical protein AWC04_06680 [Mycolicibacterium fallax]BBY96927.1 hypothetical protein MFAL_03940 [Mycolicibacterium fallax]
MTIRIHRALTAVQGYAGEPVPEGAYEMLDQQQRQMAGDLWDAADAEADGLRGAAAVTAALAAHHQAEEVVVDLVVLGSLDPRAVHEDRHRDLYGAGLGAPVDPTESAATRADTRHWFAEAERRGVDIERIGDHGSYSGADSIESLALPPRAPWGPADHRAMLEDAVRLHGLAPGRWIELEWPPTAGLATPGQVVTTSFAPCDRHENDADESRWDDCADCQDSVREVVESMAEWTWIAPLTVRQIRFDVDGTERSEVVYADPGHEVATTTQDPRDVLIGPPGRDTKW